MNPTISIITPIFNNSVLIKETINSVVNQSYANWEMIIVDDGSDNIHFNKVSKFISKYQKISLVKRNRLPKGPSTCRNIGAKIAKGDYLIFLDSDDLLADFCLKERFRIMFEKPKLDFAVFNQELFQNKIGDISILYNKYTSSKKEYIKLFLENTNPWTVTCPIWKTEFFSSLNGFNEEYFFMEDPELHTRALLRKDVEFYIHQTGKPDSFYRQDNWNLEKTETFWQNSIMYRIKYLKEIFTLTQNKTGENEFTISLQIFLNILIKYFLISRIKDFKNEYFELIKWANESKIITRTRLYSLSLLGYTNLSNNYLIKILKLKGILFKLILR